MLSRFGRAGAARLHQRPPWHWAQSAIGDISDGPGNDASARSIRQPSSAEQASVQPELRASSPAWLTTSAEPPSTDAKSAPDDRLAILFTCGQCQARTMRSFSRRAYDNGIVIVQCPSCSVKHLVADRLGWFGEPGSVEDFMKQRGGGVQWNAADGSLELTADDAQAWAQMAAEQKERETADASASGRDKTA